jgi:hypothetical protein
MPIQITELNISVSVNQPGTSSLEAGQSAATGTGSPERIVEECVEQIMKILNDKKER